MVLLFALFSPCSSVLLEAPGKGEIVSRVFDFRSFHFFCSLSHLFCCVYAIFSRAGLIEEQNSAVRFEWCEFFIVISRIWLWLWCSLSFILVSLWHCSFASTDTKCLISAARGWKEMMALFLPVGGEEWIYFSSVWENTLDVVFQSSVLPAPLLCCLHRDPSIQIQCWISLHNEVRGSL